MHSRIPILMYHQIDQAAPRYQPSGARTRYRSLIVSPQSFARQMWLIRALGYRGVNMSEVMQYWQGQKTASSHGKVVGITFDDGYENNLVYALPVLARYAFSSTSYVVSQKIGQFNDWDSDNGIAAKRLMDQSQLMQWLAGGQEIGSHTQHHVNLLACDDAAAQAEIQESKKTLEALTHKACEHFCYPYGSFNAHHVEMVRAAGYASATTVRHGVAQGGSGGAGEALLTLPRLAVLKNTSLMRLWRMLRA